MKSAKLLFLALPFLCVLGCATSRQVVGPNGETLHSIDCSGSYSNIGMCLEKAGKICGERGYEILMGNTANHGMAATSGQYGYFAAPVVSREIVIRCKGAAAAPSPGIPAAPGGD